MRWLFILSIEYYLYPDKQASSSLYLLLCLCNFPIFVASLFFINSLFPIMLGRSYVSRCSVMRRRSKKKERWRKSLFPWPSLNFYHGLKVLAYRELRHGGRMRLGLFAYKYIHVRPYPLHIRRFATVKMWNKFTTDTCSPKMSVEELDRLSEKKLVFYLALCL